MKRKIFLSGGNGFIGRNLKDGLGAKYTVIAPTHKQLDLLDFRQVSNFFKKEGPFDVVLSSAVNGGRRSLPDTQQVGLDNLRIFFNLAGCSEHFKKLIHFGSGAEFDKSREIKHIKESELGSAIPASYFGFSKYVIAKYIEENEKFVNLRLFGVYGKHENYKIGFVSNAICRAMFNLPIIINKNVFFEYIYASDLIPIVSFFIENKSRYQSYNVGPGKPIDLKTIAKIIKKVSGSKSGTKVMSSGLNLEYSCRTDRIKKELKYKFSDHEKSLMELFAWYKRRKHLIDVTTLN